MISFFRSIFYHRTFQGLLLYSGFIALLLTWPIANIVSKNDSFRFIGGWSLTAYFVFLFIFAVLPVVLLTGIEYFLRRKNEKYSLFFRNFIFITGAAIFWTQLTEFHLTPLLKWAGIITTPLRYSGLYFIFFFSGLIFIIFVYKLKKYIPLFFKYLSLLMIFALGLLFLNTLQTEAIYLSVNKNLPPISQPPSLKKNIYLLIFDGVSLARLMEEEEINKELFPNFYRLSKEWTWYENATTNGTSSATARTMMFSGRYFGDKLSSLRGFNDILFQRVGSVMDNHVFLDIDIFKGDSQIKSLSHALWLNKALFTSYLEVSLPPPLRDYIALSPFRSWKFDWRGETPREFRGKESSYQGKQFQEQFFNFLKESTDVSEEGGSFFLLWSAISHYPFIFDERGNIIEEPKYHTFKVGMKKEDVQKVNQNNVRVLQYVDSLLGLFLKQLEESRLYEGAVILVTSDHGFSDTGSNYDINEQVFRIPFFLKAPNLPKGVNERDVQTVDITPTLVDILGLPLPAEYDGQSLLRPYQERDKIIYALGVPGFKILPKDGF